MDFDFLDSVPVVGLVKGSVQYACGGKKGGKRALKASSRSTLVSGAGALGFLGGGPMGAAAAGAATGTAFDSIDSVASGRSRGVFRGVEEIVDHARYGQGFPLAATFVTAAKVGSDGFSGYCGGGMTRAYVDGGRGRMVRAGAKALGGQSVNAISRGKYNSDSDSDSDFDSDSDSDFDSDSDSD